MDRLGGVLAIGLALIIFATACTFAAFDKNDHTPIVSAPTSVTANVTITPTAVELDELSELLQTSTPVDHINQTPNAPNRRTYEGIQVTPLQAFDRFKEHFPNAKVKQIEIEKLDNGFYAYEVEGYEGNSEFELKIDALDGRALKKEQSRHNGVAGEILKEDLAGIQDLISRALQDAGEGFQVWEWEVEVKRGLVVLEVELISRNSTIVAYKFDLRSGELLEIDR